MLFNSFTFLIFLAVVLGAYYLLPLAWRGQKAMLTLASFLFYAAWNPPFVLLLWFSTVVDWYAARGIAGAANPTSKRLWLLVTLGVNLGLLGFFKYGGFLLENFVATAASVGVVYAPPAWDIILPVGISFYTFQTLSYTLDVYLGRMKPADSFGDYAFFVAFFPQLVAGPIVRAAEFLPQCQTPKRADHDQLAWGLVLVIVGLFGKIVMADGLFAPVVEAVYAPAFAAGSGAAWIGTIAFAGQIFCDFAGYSTAACGLALCFGFSLPRNFRHPYAALGFSDFWRRWHISLSTWLRDYLYIPLGGNRDGALATERNLMVTMLLGGLWHGASWNFVIWGGLHGGYLVAERRLRATHFADAALWQAASGRAFIGALTFTMVCIAWVFFRADDLPQSMRLLSAMAGAAPADGAAAPPAAVWAMLGASALVATQVLLRDRSLGEVWARAPRGWVTAALAAMLVAIATMPGEDRAFIYFQF